MLDQGMTLVGKWCVAASKIGVLQALLLLASISFWMYGTRDPLSRRFLREVCHSVHIAAYRFAHEAAHITYNVRRLVDAAEWRAADAIVGAWLTFDGVITSIGLNLGSPPLTRGIRSMCKRTCRPPGFIPAHAGNTCPRYS